MASVSGSVRLAAPRAAGAVVYDNRVVRYRQGAASSSFQPAQRAAKLLQGTWSKAPTMSPLQLSGWGPGRQVGYGNRMGLRRAEHVGSRKATRWELGADISAAAPIRFQDALRVATARHSGFERGKPIGYNGGFRFQRGTWQDVLRVQAWQTARSYSLALADAFEPATRAGQTWFFVGPWQLGTRAQFGRVKAPPGTVDPEEPQEPQAQIVIPVRRFYMVMNAVSLRRVSDDAELQAYTFGMSIDADSWTWSFNASLHRDALALVHPAGGNPIELEADVNGVQYRLLVVSVGRSRRFPETRITISGRGLSAVLAEPYAPVQTFANTLDRTGQQLMADVLTVNGVSLGWSLQWGLTDWLVPAGAWSTQGTYMQALNDIASAAGGYIQPHRTDATLRVLPRYPAAPWAWASVAPDIELPAASVSVESIEWLDKPAYNRVYVGGVSTGVFGPVTRTGSGGDMVAPQVTHALITHADAQRQRGIAELSDTGRQAHVQLRLQVLPQTGLIVPGTFVRYLAGPGETHIGIVRAASLEWASPALRQTIRIETHDAA